MYRLYRLVIYTLLLVILIQLRVLYNLNDSACVTMVRPKCARHQELPVFLVNDIAEAPHEVLRMQGYNITFIKTKGASEIDQLGHWDVIWSRTDPFKMKSLQNVILNMTSQQKMNHIPQLGVITDKASLTTKGGKYIPKTYLMPHQKNKFLKEVGLETDEQRVWIQKNYHHRGNEVVKTSELDLDGEKLIQEFISNPFLLEGYAFSLAFFVIVTSVRPMRVYMVGGEIHIRLCRKEYYPIDYKVRQKYIAEGAPHLDVSEFTPLKKYMELYGYSEKQLFNAYVNYKTGLSTGPIYDQALEAIADVFLFHMGRLKLKYPPGLESSFFDIMRWDFILDDNMQLHLLEANTSPGMSNPILDVRLQNLLVIHNTLNILGLLAGGKSNISVRDADVHPTLEVCYQANCKNCTDKACQLCPQCLSQEDRKMLKRSYFEHINRKDMRRVFPERMSPEQARIYIGSANEHLKEHEQMNLVWFRAKCLRDYSWCM